MFLKLILDNTQQNADNKMLEGITIILQKTLLYIDMKTKIYVCAKVKALYDFHIPVQKANTVLRWLQIEDKNKEEYLKILCDSLTFCSSLPSAQNKKLYLITI